MRRLIEAALNPFKDPFLVDFGTHRWLSGAREEAYSDWLGWIVERLQTPERVFRLFGIDDDCGVALCQGILLTVDREMQIPQRHLNQTGRLDLVMHYANTTRIVVEVKKTGTDQADTVKQQGYKSWVGGQLEPCKHTILLASAAEREEYEGFRLRLWSDICVELRRMVPILCQEKKLLEAAMMLAFVGAVEQNLLRFSAHLIQRVYEGYITMLPTEKCKSAALMALWARSSQSVSLCLGLLPQHHHTHVDNLPGRNSSMPAPG